MEYLRADKLNYDPRPQISRVFVEGFYQWLRYFSKDKEKLARALIHMFDASKFYVAVDGETIAAITAFTDGIHPPIRLDKNDLRSHLGLIGGTFAYSMLKKNLENHPYPFEVTTQMGSIEFVATAPEYRGQGVAADLIRHIMDEMPCSDYILEVADTNKTALRLYERLGFAEFIRVPEKHPKQSGLNYYVYMKRVQKTKQKMEGYHEQSISVFYVHKLQG
jgi:GNAT superfamily N-acetyltransferase